MRAYVSACVCLSVCMYMPAMGFFFFNMRPTSSLPLSLPLGPAVDTHVESGIRSWGIVPFLDHWAWLPCLEGQADKTGLPACASQMAIHHGDSRTLAGRGKILTWQTRRKKKPAGLSAAAPVLSISRLPALFQSDMGGRTRQARSQDQTLASVEGTALC